MNSKNRSNDSFLKEIPPLVTSNQKTCHTNPKKKYKLNNSDFNVKNDGKFMTVDDSVSARSKWDLNEGMSVTPYDFEKSLCEINLSERMSETSGKMSVLPN